MVLLTFGTCLFLGRGIYASTAISTGDVPHDPYWISNSIRLTYRTPFNCFRWIPQMTIVPFLSTLLFMDNDKDIGSYCIIAMPLLICGTFQFVSLLLFMLGVILYRLFTEKQPSILLKELFGFQNIALLGCAFVTVIYLAGNVFGDKPENWPKFAFINYGDKSILYFCFAITFLVYSLVIFNENKNNLLFYFVNIQLLIFPFFTYGKWNDFVMNGAMPACFILMIFVIQSLLTNCKLAAQRPQRLIALVLILSLGAIYPLQEMVSVAKRPISFQGTTPGSLNNYARRDGTVPIDWAYNYYTYDYEDSIFYKVCAKS